MKKLIPLILLTFLAGSLVAQDSGYLLETDRYKITFPQKPSEHMQPVQSAIGELKAHMYVYEAPDEVADGNHIYMIAITDYPDSMFRSAKKDMLEKFLSAAVDGSVQNVKGKLLTQSPIEINGYPGRYFTIDYRNGAAVITVHCYLVKNAMYMVQVISEGKKSHNPAIKKFMDSFSLKD